jgi:hypothetical protein
MLHVTNGESAARQIRAAQALGTVPAGPVLSWDDVLHEGPVPAGLNFSELTAVRACFLATCGAAPFAEVHAGLRSRDRALLESSEAVLWFEHDLYDQLQLIQILAELPAGSHQLIQSDEFLGPMRPEEIGARWPRRVAVSDHHREVASRAWSAFRAADPAELRSFPAADGLDAHPFLAGAFSRHLEEFPSGVDGLSRTERQILTVVASGTATFRELFPAWQKQETAPAFMGDWALQLYVTRLSGGVHPLLTPEPYHLTAFGQEVLAQQRNHIQLNGISRWLGGVHLYSEPVSGT